MCLAYSNVGDKWKYLVPWFTRTLAVHANSVDEMIERDLPETLDFVLKRTGRQKLFFVGHSQGTSIMFGLLSLRPEYSEKVREMFPHFVLPAQENES